MGIAVVAAVHGALLGIFLRFFLSCDHCYWVLPSSGLSKLLLPPVDIAARSGPSTLILHLQTARWPTLINVFCCLTLQLVLVLLLQDLLPRLQQPPQLFDPAFSDFDKLLLQHLGLAIIPVNEGGARTVQVPTFFYMPHCEVRGGVLKFVFQQVQSGVISSKCRVGVGQNVVLGALCF